jgi:hypothetical protein
MRCAPWGDPTFPYLKSAVKLTADSGVRTPHACASYSYGLRYKVLQYKYYGT